nr:lasso peptide isopeptide bond-forming cyclase [Streptomyces cupreus]
MPPGRSGKAGAVTVALPHSLRAWFVVLPDCPSTEPVHNALQQHAEQHVSHPSGRPWLLGRWSPESVAVGGAGATRLAVIGQHATTSDHLARAATDIHTLADVDRLATSLVGSSYLIASVAGRVRAQGTVTATRRVFHADLRGVPVAADRAEVLACLLGARIDRKQLALYLLEPQILPPLTGASVWRGVKALPGGDYLVLDGDGRTRTIRWWSPPRPTVPMPEGAAALREALSAAVAARVDGRDLVSCDLGGLDSTSVCCLAARTGTRVTAYTVALHDPFADDVRWGVRTTAALENVEHHVIQAEEVPLFYAGVQNFDDPLGEPTSGAERDRGLVTVRRAAARGSQLHLTGIGGDELLYGSLAHLHTQLRIRPRVAARQLRGFAAKYRWPRGVMLRQLADNRPYRVWLGAVADELTAPPPPIDEPLLAWGFVPRLPPWATPDAVEAVHELIREAARTAEPLSPWRGQHRELATMQAVSRLGAELGEMGTRIGITVASPYHDDRVIEAGLAVRPEDRISPWRYKPLIHEAMRGIVPEESLTRQTKDTAACDEAPGLRRHRPELLALWKDSRLAQLGLIDAEAVREVCTGPIPPHLGENALYQTVACETWLRALEGAAVAR